MSKGTIGFFGENFKSLKRAANIIFFSVLFMWMGFDPAVSRNSLYELILGGFFIVGLGYAYLWLRKDARRKRILDFGLLFGLVYASVSTALFTSYLINTEIPRLKMFGRFAYMGVIVFLIVRYVRGASRVGTNLILACFYGSLPFLALQLQTPYKGALTFFFLLGILADRILGFRTIKVLRYRAPKSFVLFLLLYALLPWLYAGFKTPMLDFADGFFLQGIPICLFLLFVNIAPSAWSSMVQRSVGTLFIVSGFFLFAALSFFSFQNGLASLIFVKKTILAGTNTNDIATLLSLSMPWVLHGFFCSRKWKARTFFLVCFCLLAAGTFVIHVRGLYIAFFATVFVFFFLKFVSEKLRLMFVGILVVLLGLFAWIFFQNFKFPLFDNFHSLWARTLLWRLALRALVDNWIFGIGAFQYKGLLVWGNPLDLPPGVFMQEDLGRIHVHNLFLQVGLNWGIFPALGLLGCFFFALFPFLKADRIQFRSSAFGFRISLFCFGVYSMANYSFNIAGLHTAFSLLLFASLPPEFSTPIKNGITVFKKGIGRYISVVVAFLFLCSACFLLHIEYLHSEQIALTKGFRSRNLLNDLVLDENFVDDHKIVKLREAFAISERLVRIFPKDPIFLEESAELARVLYSKTREDRFLNVSIGRFEACTSYSSNPWFCFYNLERLKPVDNSENYKKSMKKFNPFLLPLEKRSPF